MERRNVGPGEFPFPLIEGPDESRYLTWVRNHSNYMAVRGFLDYVRMVAVLLRGVLVNFLTLLPPLMVGALLLGLLYNPMLDDWHRQIEVEAQEMAATNGGDAAAPERFFLTREVAADGRPDGSDPWRAIGGWVWWVQERAGTRPPFLLTPIIVVLGLAYYCLFPVVSRLFRVVSHKKALATGSSSSVRLRDLYERSFSVPLVAALGMALIELLPLLIHQFHQAKASGLRGLLTVFASGGSALAVSGAGKLLSVLGDAKRTLAMKTLAMIFIGLLGLILPLIVVLHVSEYLVYSEAGTADWEVQVLTVVPVLLLIGGLATLILGLTKGAFDRIGWLLRLILLVTASLGILWALSYYGILEGRWFMVLALALEIWLFCWLAVDVNLTSIHDVYRDRLAAAYLVGEDTSGDVDIEEDIDLHEICRYETFSTAPYYLVNVSHNLQASKDIAIRERNSDFFIFSKRFVGSGRTGYCRSESLERVFPQIDLATAMAISAAAAAPNMGTGTSRAMVALMTLLNVRMGYWVPNPGLLEAALAKKDGKPRERALSERQPDPGYDFSEVFREELGDLHSRWQNVYPGLSVRGHCERQEPTPEHGFIGLGMSGGGIRSATINLGILQVFVRRGVFDHIDYMSTVSGGGYLGSSISTLMRTRTPTFSELAGEVKVEEATDDNITRITVTGEGSERVYEYRQEASVSEQVKKDKRVAKGQSLISSYRPELANLMDRFNWRVRPVALVREMFSLLDETRRWINLSDGGHLENLATIELLRRRCRFIITSDCEADPKLHLGSLATLIRFARIDLGIQIQLDPGKIHLREDRSSEHHFAIGRIWYPKYGGGGYESTPGYLLYLKSSFTGDEEEIVHHYRNTHPAFPHETTADQFFDEGQFEAYRALGQHIGEKVLEYAPGTEGDWSFEQWFESGKTVPDFFQAWCSELEKQLPAPWKKRSEPA